MTAGTEGTGKRAGSRRGSKPKARLQSKALLLIIGITVSVIAWGFLVYRAISNGQNVRAGDESAWILLIASGAGAVACLFVGFILVARLLHVLARTTPHVEATDQAPSTGGRGRRIRGEDS